MVSYGFHGIEFRIKASFVKMCIVKETLGKDVRMSSDSKKNQPNNEIDDFTRALLDKKTELALFPDSDDDITTSSIGGIMDEEQKKNAESTMLSALDQLRAARGQIPIEEEESFFASEDVFDETPYDIPVDPVTDPDSPAEEKNTSGKTREQIQREKHLEVQEQRPAASAPFYKRKGFWIGFICAAVVGLLFAGYYWKTMVYDPANAVTAEQQQAYDRLVNYADEYSMMLDSEKEKITSLEADYQSLTEAQKEKINEYFAQERHVGMTFEEALAQFKPAQPSEQDEAFNSLLSFVQNYGTADDAAKASIVNYVEQYNSLDDAQKQAVNDAMNASAGMDFMSAVDAQNAAAAAAAAQEAPAEEPAAENPNAEQIASLQSQLASLKSDRENYVQFLAEEGQSADGDSVVAEYDSQIAQTEAQLASLGA